MLYPSTPGVQYTPHQSLDCGSLKGEAPALQKKGRGWKISEKRLDALHERARELRRQHPAIVHAHAWSRASLALGVRRT